MSLDRSLKVSGGLTKHRNVLTRAERITRLRDLNRFTPGEDTPLHLPKVGNRKIVMAKKGKKKTEE